MKKTYYFPHEYNSANDPKVICLLGNFGGLGYGLFWLIVEMLHQENTHKLPKKIYIYEAIAKQMQASAKQIEAIIEDCIIKFELFKSDDEFFWSDRVFENIAKQVEVSEKRRIAGKIGARIKQDKQLLSKPKQTLANKIKENKIKDILQPKVAEKNIPTYEQIKSDKSRHIQIIGLFWEYTCKEFDNYEQYQSQLQRHLKASKMLIGYSNEQIIDAMEKCETNSQGGKKYNWTLDTVLKNL